MLTATSPALDRFAIAPLLLRSPLTPAICMLWYYSTVVREQFFGA